MSTSLADLPQPAVIEKLDYEAILADKINQLKVGLDAIGIAYDVDKLESDPAVKLLEVSAYAELLLRARINTVYRSRLLYFATGEDLDHAADDNGVARLNGESDAALRTRVRLWARGSSSAGPDDWWRFHAMTADPLVEDVAVSRVTFPIPAPAEQRGSLRISVLARTPDGVPPPEVLTRVSQALTSRSVRGVTTSVEVVPATLLPVNVVADVWLLPDALPGTVAAIEPALRAAWSAARALGWDVTSSWLISQLHRQGIRKVVLDGFVDVVAAADQLPVLGTVTLRDRGPA